MAKDPITAEDLQRETMALQVLTDEFARTRDPDKIKELTHLTQDQADRIRTVAEQLGDQHEEEWAERQAEAQAGGAVVEGRWRSR